MDIDRREAVRLGDTTQWIRVRGADTSNPVLLLIQQGPGLPMLNEVRRFEKLLGLEQVFTVVYWDQRGCGRTLRRLNDHAEISTDRMTDDTVALLELLRDRFGSPSFVAGFSFGATIGALAAARRPDLVATLVTVGMDVDGPVAAAHTYAFALGTACMRGNRRAIRQLESVGAPPHLHAKQFATRARWTMNFGGVATNETYGTLVRELLASLVRSPDYSAADVVRTIRGMTTTQAALLSDLATLDLQRSVPSLAVPVVMVQGRLDQVAPGDAAQRYANDLVAPSKQLVWFEHSAHTPHLEEPEKFRDLLVHLRAGQLTTT